MSKTALSDEQNNNSTLFTQILKVYQAVYSSQNKGVSAPEIKNETVLLLCLINCITVMLYHITVLLLCVLLLCSIILLYTVLLLGIC